LRLRLGLQIPAQQRLQGLVVPQCRVGLSGLVISAHEHAMRLFVVGLALEETLQRSHRVTGVAELELELGQLACRAEELARDALAMLFKPGIFEIQHELAAMDRHRGTEELSRFLLAAGAPGVARATKAAT